MKILYKQISPEIFNTIPVLNSLQKQTKEELFKISRLISIRGQKNNKEEFQLGQQAYLAISEKISLSYISVEGKKIITEMLEPGDFFGCIHCSNKGIYENDLVFVEPLTKKDIVLCEFEKDKFGELVLRNQDLAGCIVNDYERRIRRLKNKIKELSLLNKKTQILVELKKIGTVEGEEHPVVTIDSKITHEKIAESLGTARETISKEIIKLRRQGIIRYDKTNRKMLVRLNTKKILDM